MSTSVLLSTPAPVGDGRLMLGESPRWHGPSQTLWWVDILASRLHWLDPDGQVGQRQLPRAAACLALDATGGMVLGGEGGFARLPSPPDGEWQWLTDPEADKPWQRLNDGRCDPAGRFIAGSQNPRKDQHYGTFYCLTGEQARPLVGRSWTCNGLAFSPDGRTLYWSDTPNRVIYACDYDVDRGAVSHQRVFFVVPEGWGRPDGACVDSEGCYWSALYAGGGLLRIGPDGTLRERVPLPVSNPTMPCFGGADLTTLYVTSARQKLEVEHLAAHPLEGALLCLQTSVVGLAETPWRP